MSHYLYVAIPLLLVVLFVAVAVAAANAQAQRRDQREAFIRGYRFPAVVRHRADAVTLEALRGFLLVCLAASAEARSRPPSKEVDDAWHEFILCTREYRDFCRKAFGKYLHHRPDEPRMSPMPHGCSTGGGIASVDAGGAHGHAHGHAHSHAHGCAATSCSGGASCGGGGGCSS